MLGRLRAGYRNASLRTKLALHVALSTVLVVSLMLPAVLYIQRRVILTAVEESGFRTTDIFARSSVQAVLADDYLVMQHVVNGITSEKKVLYAMLLKEDGEVLVHTRAIERGRRYTDPVSRAAATARSPRLQRIVDGDGTRVYDFTVPVYVLDEKRASARLGLSIEHELREIARTRNAIVGFGLGVLALGLAWATYQARGLMAPVRALVHGTEEVARGNLDHRIPVRTRDEMGQLAQAFNHMTESVQALIETSREISTALDLDVVLRSITEHALRLVRADVAFMAPVERNGQEARVRVTLGTGTERLQGMVVAPGVGLGGAVLVTGEAIASDNYVSDPRFVHDPEYDKGVVEAGIVSALALPVLLKGEIIGILWVAKRTAEAFSGEDLDALRRMAHQAAIAMENARLFQDLRQSHEDLLNAQAELVWKTRMAAMGEIAAAVAHEARNPLGALSNCIQLLRANPDITGEDAELLTIMQNESKRLNEIVSDFLAFGRPRAPRFAPVDLHELIDETWTLLQRDDRCPPSVAFARGYDAALDAVTADRDQLRQVFWNLFLNAVQAMRDEGTLTVETRRTEGGAEIRVRDTGPGISPAVLPRVFEPFVTTKAGGTGLGLAIVRRIIEDHGGRITVEAHEGEGTCFVLSLADARKA